MSAGNQPVIVTPAQVQPVVVVAGAGQGPAGGRGPVGPAGGSAVSTTAGQTVSALQMVYELDGKVFVLTAADPDNIFLALGLTVTAADADQPVDVQRGGIIDEASWAWTPGPVWLSPTGGLTQIPPADGFDLMVGSALSATRLLLDLQQPIELE